jgi:hypothetical protein
MFWAWKSKGDAETKALMDAFSDIDKSNDRAAAIVAAAFLEDHLAIALKERFHEDKKTIEDTFRSNGPLGSFAAKIDMAFLIGLCSKDARDELHTIRTIRNEFAHRGLTNDFNSQRVRNLANNLQFGRKVEITMRRVDKEDDAKSGEPVAMYGEEDMLKTPREHYIRACQMLLTFFVMAKHTNPITPPTPEF